MLTSTSALFRKESFQSGNESLLNERKKRVEKKKVKIRSITKPKKGKQTSALYCQVQAQKYTIWIIPILMSIKSRYFNLSKISAWAISFLTGNHNILKLDSYQLILNIMMKLVLFSRTTFSVQYVTSEPELPRSMKWSRSIDRSIAFFAIEINLLIKPIYRDRDRDRKGLIKIDLDCSDT